MAVSLQQHVREGLIAVINAFNTAISDLYFPNTVNARWYGAGFLTGSQKWIRFQIPTNGYVPIGSEVTLTNVTIYLRKSAGTNYDTLTDTDISNYSISVSRFGIRVELVLNNALSSYPNNSVVGIDFTGTLEFN